MSAKDALSRLLRSFSSIHRAGEKPDIFLLSTPRSGSTWLLETIAAEKRVRSCNEPFNIRKPFIARRIGIDSWEELASPEAESTIERYLASIIAGRPGHAFRNKRPFELGYEPITDRMVFKILFACEDKLDWIRERFGAQIVCLVRHPIPVSLSREQLPRLPTLLKSASAWLDDEQTDLATRIVKEGSYLEKAQLDWCLQNRPLFDYAGRADLFVTYEQMVLEPEVVVERLIQSLGLTSQSEIRRSVQEISGSVSKSSASSIRLLEQRDRNRLPLISKWRDQVLPEQESHLMNIVARLGINAYRGGNLLADQTYWIPGGQARIEEYALSGSRAEAARFFSR